MHKLPLITIINLSIAGTLWQYTNAVEQQPQHHTKITILQTEQITMDDGAIYVGCYNEQTHQLTINKLNEKVTIFIDTKHVKDRHWASSKEINDAVRRENDKINDAAVRNVKVTQSTGP